MTNWIKLYLRTDTEEEMITVVNEAELITYVDNQKIFGNNTTQVAVLGILTQGTGVMLDDGEGNQYEQQEIIPGYHVNILTVDETIVTILNSVTIPEPNTPIVTWDFQ